MRAKCENCGGLLSKPEIRVFVPTNSHEGGVFKGSKGATSLLMRVAAQTVETMVEDGALTLVRGTDGGRLFRAVALKDRRKPAQTARDHRNAPWLAADRLFTPGPDQAKQTIAVNMAESPIGWLAKRRDANGQPFLTKDELAAGERLRGDFERSQLGPSVTQDWRRFLTAGIDFSGQNGGQDRDCDGGAEAARQRLSDALGSLGPGLSDVALRVCCFLEGIGSVETSMKWSARSGKVVLKIALQRLATFYECASVRSSGEIEVWLSSDA